MGGGGGDSGCCSKDGVTRGGLSQHWTNLDLLVHVCEEGVGGGTFAQGLDYRIQSC